MRFARAAVLGLLALGVAAPVTGQDLERIRALYVAAAYEDALAAMPPPGTDGTAVIEIEQYRALCLLALGRDDAAAGAIERLVRSHPMYVPSGDLTPRMRTLFAEARTKQVPGLAKQTYADAKAAYDEKNLEAARGGFQYALALIESLGEAEQGRLTDLRTLAEGFLALTSAAAPAPAATTPATNGQPPEPAGPFVPPVAISEQLPPWSPPDTAAKRAEYVGLLRIQIGEDGRVQSASIVDASHPAYDMAVLRAAHRWTYKPATRGGRPVPSQKDIQIRLVPR